jgi:hypothetical protein
MPKNLRGHLGMHLDLFVVWSGRVVFGDVSTPDWILQDTLSTVIDGLANVVHPLRLVMDTCRPVTGCKMGLKYLRGCKPTFERLFEVFTVERRQEFVGVPSNSRHGRPTITYRVQQTQR